MNTSDIASIDMSLFPPVALPASDNYCRNVRALEFQ